MRICESRTLFIMWKMALIVITKANCYYWIASKLWNRPHNVMASINSTLCQGVIHPHIQLAAGSVIAQ